MTIYTFRPLKEDRTFSPETRVELVNDAVASVVAGRLLEDLPDAKEVIVTCGKRRVLTRDRDGYERWELFSS